MLVARQNYYIISVDAVDAGHNSNHLIASHCECTIIPILTDQINKTKLKS